MAFYKQYTEFQKFSDENIVLESWRNISVGILLPLQAGGSAFGPQNYIHNVKSLGKYMRSTN